MAYTNPEDELDTFLEFCSELDEETHEWGKDRRKPDKPAYDVDYIDTTRMLTGSEAATVYLGVKEHDTIALYRTMLEEPQGQDIHVSNDKRMTTHGETFRPGYRLFHGPIDDADGDEDRETVLTVAEIQLPDRYDYVDQFQEFHASEENKRRALAMGLDDVTNLSQGQITAEERDRLT